MRACTCWTWRGEGQRLRPDWLKTWPRGSIQARWPAVMGVDYASAPDPGKPGDYFALALGRVMPDGRLVVEDGVRARLTQAEAEQVVLDWAARTPTLRLILVEGDGGGTDVYQVLLMASGLPLKVMKTGGTNKAQRIETRLAPLFEQGRIWLADGETAFLNAFRQEWAQFPLGAHDDTLDAVFWMAAAAQPDLLVGLTPERKTPREPSPFAVWGRT